MSATGIISHTVTVIHRPPLVSKTAGKSLVRGPRAGEAPRCASHSSTTALIGERWKERVARVYAPKPHDAISMVKSTWSNSNPSLRWNARRPRNWLVIGEHTLRCGLSTKEVTCGPWRYWHCVDRMDRSVYHGCLV
jgi:hypothetical protein